MSGPMVPAPMIATCCGKAREGVCSNGLAVLMVWRWSLSRSGFTSGGGDDAVAQAHFVIDKIEGALQSLGSRLEDVVRTRVYVRNIADWEAVARVHGERLAGIQPANTLVQVGLVGDGYLVEMEAEAVVEGP